MPKETLELLEVHRGGAEDRIDGIARGALEAITIEAVFAFEMADGGFDCGAAFHPFPERFGSGAAAAFVHMHDLEAVIAVATIAHVYMRFLEFPSRRTCVSCASSVCPAANTATAPAWTSPYTNLLKDALTAKAQLVIDSLVLSEYMIRYMRIEHAGALKAKWPDFKAFRKSVDFSPVGKAAVADARYILKLAAPQDTLLPSLDVPGILGEMESGTMDLNDGVIVENCRAKGWKLVSNDGDITFGGIEVLTINGKLLKACP